MLGIASTIVIVMSLIVLSVAADWLIQAGNPPRRIRGQSQYGCGAECEPNRGSPGSVAAQNLANRGF
jgi:hypothetical protein